MSWLQNLDLIRFFEFYLAAMFLLSTALRLRQYFAVLALLSAMPGRWPRLLNLIKQSHGVFLSWETILPIVLALVLLLFHMMACHLLWPQASLTLAGLFQLWPAVPFVLVPGIAMVLLDSYTTLMVGKLERPEIEKYFDQAEYWLRPWVAPVVRVVTFGYVDPRQMVSVEVQKAMVELKRLLHVTLWWVSLQTGLRIVYGLALWLTYAFSGPLT